MDVNIQKKTERALLKRTDVTARVAYEGATPQRQALKDKLAAALKQPVEKLVIRQITTEFGKQAAIVEASVYDSVESLEQFEPRHMKKRHGMAVAEKTKKKKGGKK
jgi:ribosomal protein S24E